MVSNYINQTSSNEAGYSLELQQVFYVERNGEQERFEKFSKLDNRI